MEFEKENNRTPSMKKLCLLSYAQLRKRYAGYSQYALGAISKAAGILSARRKSIRRGFHTNTPYVSRPVLVSCYGFKVGNDGNLVVHVDANTLESIPLNSHTRAVLSEDPLLKVRSFTLTAESISLCVSEEIEGIAHGEIAGVIGIDRNLTNITVGNANAVTYYDTTYLVDLAENTRSIIRSFKRGDDRIRQKVASKYGMRRSNRTRQFLNLISKRVVEDAKTNRQAIVFEEITGIRKLYRRGNGHGKFFRGKMNSWPFGEIKRQIQYKAAWEGVPVITLTRDETRGTTMDCARCGERLQVPVRGDSEHYRQVWCEKCETWMDRDLVAVLNISRKGRVRFARSTSEGGASETVKGNAEHDGEPLILRVDASKLHHGRPSSRTNLRLS